VRAWACKGGGGGRWPTRPRLIWGPDAGAGTGIRTVD